MTLFEESMQRFERAEREGASVWDETLPDELKAIGARYLVVHPFSRFVRSFPRSARPGVRRLLFAQGVPATGIVVEVTDDDY